MYNNIIKEVGSLCSEKYSETTYQHCLRVANYASNNVCLLTSEEREIAFKVGLCHDLLEDTDATIKEICEVTGFSEEFVADVLGALTKQKSEMYLEYINRLKKNESKYSYIVKLADMKDHLMQTETLTDKLKQKYWQALPYLL